MTIEREVTITALCQPGQGWSPRRKADAIRDIEFGQIRYFVSRPGGKAWIHVVNGPTGKYLRTNWDHTNRNNLDDLPDC